MAPFRWSLFLACVAVPAMPGHAAELFASDGQAGDRFGRSVSIWGPLGVVGAYNHNVVASGPAPEYGHGVVYLYRELDRAAGRVREAGKLMASDGRPGDGFGRSTSLHGTSCLIGGPAFNSTGAGAAYLFRDLDVAGAWVTETATLRLPDPPPRSRHDLFGYSVALWGEMGLVGAKDTWVEGRQGQGSAYLFHNLDTATGDLTESVTLLALDGQARDSFGASVALGEVGALVVAPGVKFEGVRDYQGAVYLFRDLEATTTGVLTETATLAPSGGSWWMDAVDSGVSLWGASALIKAEFKPTFPTESRILAWLYRDLDRATGMVTESARLVASKRFPSYSTPSYSGVSLSGDAAVVGVVAVDFGDASFPAYGTVYLYVNLGAAEGEVAEAVRLTPSQKGDAFGLRAESVSLDGDVFLIGDANDLYGRNLVGAAYCGRVSAFTTLDEGDVDREISALSFQSAVDWIIGATTSGNRLTLGQGDEATVTEPGKAVSLGRAAGANDNTLTLAGRLTATEIFIGAVTGNRGNTLHLAKTGVVLDAALRLAPENFLTLEGDHTAPHALSERLGSATLHVWDGATWQTVDIYNHPALVRASYDTGTNLTTVASVQEPITIPVPTLSLTITEEPGQLQLRVSGAPDSAWVLQRSDDLTEWEDLQTLTLDAAGFATIIGLPAPLGAVFYRCTIAP